MSLRWRTTGELLCGAKSEPEDGDTYIDDRLHYRLSVELGVVHPHADEDETGRWHWIVPGDRFDVRAISYGDARRLIVDSFERRYIEWALRATDGNISEAARLGEVDRTTVHRLMDKHGIEREAFVGDHRIGSEP